MRVTGPRISRNGVTWRRDNRGWSNTYLPGTRIWLLSSPEKMPGPAWSLPAVQACPYAVFGPGTICGTCYADERGSYRRPSVKRAQQARFAWTRQCLKTNEGRDLFVDTLVTAIKRANRKGKAGYFRIHDSGDFFSPMYVRLWFRIAAATPEIHYWAPTRSWQAAWLEELTLLNRLPNVTVRPSALHIGDTTLKVNGLAAATTISADAWSCPATTRDNHCGDCRRCWDEPQKRVIYHMAELARIGGPRA